MNRGAHTNILIRVAIPTVEIQISTPIRDAVVVFVDLLKKLTSLFFGQFY